MLVRRHAVRDLPDAAVLHEHPARARRGGADRRARALGDLWRILVPQATPVLVALGILELAYFWNDLLGPLIYVQSQRWRTLPQSILFNYRGTYNPQWSLFMMSVLWMVVPVALMFLVLQRRFRQGFLFSGLGGR